MMIGPEPITITLWIFLFSGIAVLLQKKGDTIPKDSVAFDFLKYTANHILCEVVS